MTDNSARINGTVDTPWGPAAFRCDLKPKGLVEVTTSEGYKETHRTTVWAVEDGMLWVGPSDGLTAVYSPGSWRSVANVSDDK